MEKNLRVGFLFFCCLVGITACFILMFPQFWQAGAITIMACSVFGVFWQIVRLAK